MADRTIVVATGNPGKLREIRQVLGLLPVRVAGLGEFDAVDEPEETGTTFADNARLKARYYARATGQWCLADDSGLVVDALGGGPGVRSARYAAGGFPPTADRPAIDAANNAKLLAELSDVDDEDRSARFVCHLALADGEAVLLEAQGTIEGRILRENRGSNGFGYDPVFYVPGLDRTAAELSADQKNAVSHRGNAVRAFADKLREYLGPGG
jgi:XTP/dITP diphosphohydrolase